MLTRRDLIIAGTAIGGACATGSIAARARPDFIRRQGTQLLNGAKPFRYVGTNMWYAAYLGANASYGNRDRLKRELDRVAGLGIESVRILGSSEVLAAQEFGDSRPSATDPASTTEPCSRGSTSRSPRWASAT